MQRKVQFQPWVSFMTIPSISNYSKEEIKSTWYSPEELRRKRSSRKKSNLPICIPSETGMSTSEAVSTREVCQRQGVINSQREALLERDQDVRERDATADRYLIYTQYNQLEPRERCRSQPQEVRLLEFFQWWSQMIHHQHPLLGKQDLKESTFNRKRNKLKPRH